MINRINHIMEMVDNSWVISAERQKYKKESNGNATKGISKMNNSFNLDGMKVKEESMFFKIGD